MQKKYLLVAIMLVVSTQANAFDPGKLLEQAASKILNQQENAELEDAKKREAMQRQAERQAERQQRSRAEGDAAAKRFNEKMWAEEQTRVKEM